MMQTRAKTQSKRTIVSFRGRGTRAGIRARVTRISIGYAFARVAELPDNGADETTLWPGK
jgi:hypothetical protein